MEPDSQLSSSSTGIVNQTPLIGDSIPAKSTLLSVERDDPVFDGQWIIASFILVCLFTIIIWSAFDYVIIEQVTAEIVVSILTLLGNNCSIYQWQEFLGIPSASWRFLNEATPLTPIIFIDGVDEGPFSIVKACTGMQTGAVLLSLIIFTKRQNESFFNPIMLRTKARTFVIFYIILFIANAIRIAFHLWLTTYGVPFPIAHDALSKPIGFIGALIFAWVIEKMGVPVINTFADWMDYCWYLLSKLNVRKSS